MISGVFYSDPGGQFELLWDSVGHTILYKVLGGDFYGADEVMSSFLNQSGPVPPASASHFRAVRPGELENMYVVTANSLKLANTSRVTICAAKGDLTPFFEFTIVRNQTMIIWTAHRYAALN